MKLSAFQSFPSKFLVRLCSMLRPDLVFGNFPPFEGGIIAALNGVSVANVLNDDREIWYGIYCIIKDFL